MHLCAMPHSAQLLRVSANITEWGCGCQHQAVRHFTETSLAQLLSDAKTPCFDAEVCGPSILGLPEEEHPES